ncbi:MAG TPA: MFS transporter [Ktedonobacterales bacterium]|nr:MFS transporter [Ktedonobacterales bacterium]
MPAPLANFGNSFRALRSNARLYLVSNTLQAVTAGAFAVLYVLFLTKLGYSTDFVGLVLVIGTIGGGLGIIPASALVERLGYRALLLWSDFVGGFAFAAQLFFPTAPVILLTTLAAGASFALFLVVNAPFLAANSSEHERTALFGLNNALGFLAAVVGSLLGGGLPTWFRGLLFDGHGALAWLRPLLVRNADARTLQVALMASALIAVPAFIPILFLNDERQVSSPSDPLSSRGEGEPGRLVAWWARWGDLKTRLRDGWGATVREARGVIGRFSVTQALIGFGAGLYFPYMSIYFVNDLHTTLTFYGVFSAVMTISLAGASLLSAPLAARYGKMPVSVIAQILSIPFLVALGLFPIVWIVSATLLVRTFLMNIPGAPLSAYLMEAVPEQRRVIASGVYNVSFQLVGALGAGVGGVLINRIGFPLTILLAVPFYAASAILLIVWFGLRRQPATPPVDELPTPLVASEPLKR